MKHAPVINPHPPTELLDLLSGEAFERPRTGPRERPQR